MKIGSDVVLLYSTPSDPDIWSLAIEGKSFVTIQKAESSRRANGWWGLAIGILFLLGALRVWMRHGLNQSL
ncbi:hypothetical protein [Dyella sp. 20L07]|uniref:hypothetical protein n=1 Tax=Dyella sp. 20L07 TaxID=3384240 RepID=UPI003D296AAB